MAKITTENTELEILERTRRGMDFKSSIYKSSPSQGLFWFGNFDNQYAPAISETHKFKVMQLNSSDSLKHELSAKVIGAAIKVHKTLGPGLLESTYKECLFHELQNLGLAVEKEVELPVIYGSIQIPLGYRVDLLVENELVIELKAVEKLNEVHFSQTLTYLKLGSFKTGLLINFNVNQLIKGIRRISN